MQTSQTFKAAVICALALCSALAAPGANAQDQTAAPKLCPVDPASPIHNIYVAPKQDCSEVVEAFKRAQEQFLIGECANLEARMNAGNPAKREAANEALKKAATAYKAAGEAYAIVAEKTDPSVRLPENQDPGARKILRVFGAVPNTYKESFAYIAKVLGEAAGQLAKTSIPEDDKTGAVVRALVGSVNGPFVKPGIVWRALFVWGVTES